MALQLSVDTPNYGVTFQSAYLRISSINIGRVEDISPKFYASLQIDIFAQTPTSSLVQPIERRILNVSLDELNGFNGDDYVAKGYEYLLSIPDYAASNSV